MVELIGVVIIIIVYNLLFNVGNHNDEPIKDLQKDMKAVKKRLDKGEK